MRSGFSLVEALVAITLLATVAAACMPLLRADPRGAAGPESDPTGPAGLALEILADRIAARPGDFGVDIDGRGPFVVAWPKDLLDPKAPRDFGILESMAAPTAWALAPSDPRGEAEERERWLVVRAGDLATVRRIGFPFRRMPRRAGVERRPRRRAGMTLVETLVALTLAAAIALAVASWTTAAARFASIASARSRAEATIDAVLRVMADDLDCFDEEPSNSASGGREPRVRSEGGALVVRTRSSVPSRLGPRERHYLFDAPSGRLTARDHLPDGATESWTLAHGVERFEFSFSPAGVGSGAPRRDRRGDPRLLSIGISAGGESRALTRVVR